MSTNLLSSNHDTLQAMLEMMWNLKEPVYIHGVPGIGKSQTVRKFADGKGLKLIDFRASLIDPTDIAGQPYLDLERMLSTNFLPDYLPTEKDPAGVIFLDELDKASSAVHKALYQLILDRKIGHHYELPASWWVVAAGNLDTDGSGGIVLDSALSDRFTHILLESTPESFLKWGSENNLHPSILAYIKVHPDHLEMNTMQVENGDLVGPTNRSWHKISDFLHHYDAVGVPNRQLIQTAVCGRLGSAVTASFMNFQNEVEDLPPIEDLLKAKTNTAIYKLLPMKAPSLFCLAYSLKSYVGSTYPVDSFLRTIKAMLDNPAYVDTRVPNHECARLAMELVFTEMNNKGSLNPEELIFNPLYKEITALTGEIKGF